MLCITASIVPVERMSSTARDVVKVQSYDIMLSKCMHWISGKTMKTLNSRSPYFNLTTSCFFGLSVEFLQAIMSTLVSLFPNNARSGVENSTGNVIYIMLPHMFRRISAILTEHI